MTSHDYSDVIVFDDGGIRRTFRTPGRVVFDDAGDRIAELRITGVREATAIESGLSSYVDGSMDNDTLCFGWSHDTETRPASRLTLPQCSRRRAMR